MDEEQVRTSAETHGRATAEGDLRVAGSFLTKDAMAKAGEVMKAMPEGLHAAEVTGVEAAGDDYVALIRYTGSSGDVTVESRWAETEGAPKIVDLKVV